MLGVREQRRREGSDSSKLVAAPVLCTRVHLMLCDRQWYCLYLTLYLDAVMVCLLILTIEI